MKFRITGASILTHMEDYLPVLKDFGATDPVDNRWNDVYEITVNSLDELIKLGEAIGEKLILDTSLTPPEIGIYDNYIE